MFLLQRMMSTLNKPENCKCIFRSVHLFGDFSGIVSDGADFCSSTHDDSNGLENTARQRKLEH